MKPIKTEQDYDSALIRIDALMLTPPEPEPAACQLELVEFV